MADIIEFPKPKPRASYQKNPLAGRIIALNLSQCRKFQCQGFSLVPRLPMAIVPESNVSYERIQRGLTEGKLVDVTDDAETMQMMTRRICGISDEVDSLSLDEKDVGKRAFTGSIQFFRDLGFDMGPEMTGDDRQQVTYCTDDIEDVEKIEAAGRVKRIQLPPGFGQEDRYLLKL